MTVSVTVRCGRIKYKELKKEVIKELRKESAKELKKERIKDSKEFKERQKDFKELKEGQKDSKEFKEIKEIKEGIKEGSRTPRSSRKASKSAKDGKEFERPGGFGWRDFGVSPTTRARAAIRSPMRSACSIRRCRSSTWSSRPAWRQLPTRRRPTSTPHCDPICTEGPPTGCLLDLEKRMAEGDPMAKREFDTPPKG